MRYFNPLFFILTKVFLLSHSIESIYKCLFESLLFLRLDVQDSSVIRAGSRITNKANNLYVFEVVCLKLGETELTLHVGNKKSSTLPRPVVVQNTVTVICGQPDQLELNPEIPQPAGTSQPCPLTAR